MLANAVGKKVAFSLAKKEQTENMIAEVYKDYFLNKYRRLLLMETDLVYQIEELNKNSIELWRNWSSEKSINEYIDRKDIERRG